MEIADRHIYITGSNRGIGLEMARFAATKKAHLHLLNRSKDTKLEDELRQLGAKSVQTWVTDIGDKGSIAQTVEAVETQGLPVDILINNAGLLTGGLVEKQDPDKIVEALNVNLIGTILTTRRFLPIMLRQNTGKIVNNASVSGRMFFPGASTYAAAKAGVVAFTQCIRQELRETGVSTLLMITPGVKTDMYDNIKVQYGENLDVGFLTAIPAQDWAKQVFAAIESDQEEVGSDKFSNRLFMGLAVHATGIFEKMVASKFNRYGI